VGLPVLCLRTSMVAAQAGETETRGAVSILQQ